MPDVGRSLVAGRARTAAPFCRCLPLCDLHDFLLSQVAQDTGVTPKKGRQEKFSTETKKNISLQIQVVDLEPVIRWSEAGVAPLNADVLRSPKLSREVAVEGRRTTGSCCLGDVGSVRQPRNVMAGSGHITAFELAKGKSRRIIFPWMNSFQILSERHSLKPATPSALGLKILRSNASLLGGMAMAPQLMSRSRTCPQPAYSGRPMTSSAA